MVKVDWIDKRKRARIDVYDKELKLAYEQYIAKVEMIAARARREMLVPYLKITGWEFLTGNGTWVITDASKVRYLRNGKRDYRDYGYQMNDELPDWLDQLMRLDVEGAGDSSELALWMIDYTTRKTKNGGGQK